MRETAKFWRDENLDNLELLLDVANLTDFTDQSHLTRHFKRVVGVPPGQYAG